MRSRNTSRPPVLRRRRSALRGFTLVELVIVGALIALFSGLAVFSIQQQFRNNQRKATIAEARQVATALDLANLDVSIYPKLCWLEYSEDGLRTVGTRLFGAVADGAPIFNFMDINSRDTTGKAFGISQSWRGPYFAISQSRRGASQGQGGIVDMVIPELETFPTGNQGFRWPADPYGNPYCLYMLNVDRTSPSNPVLFFVNETSTNPEDKGSVINAIVSYGPNRVPGGGDVAAVNLADLTGPAGRRLYRQTAGNPRPTYLTPAEFTRARAASWSSVYNTNAGFGATGLALNNDGTATAGITDPGSDDVVFEF